MDMVRSLRVLASASFINLLGFLIRCRKGSADVLVNFDDLSPSRMQSHDKQDVVSNDKGALGTFQICGKEVPRGYYVSILKSTLCFSMSWKTVASRLLPYKVVRIRLDLYLTLQALMIRKLEKEKKGEKIRKGVRPGYMVSVLSF